MTNDSNSDEETYSYKSSKTVYKRSRPRPTSPPHAEREYKVYASTDAADRGASESVSVPVTKWAVDYNNKNYIRSQCNKNMGLHRNLKGRPHQYKIHYDNNYFTRSKVNAPKGLHRKIPEIKRKYVPDDDELADATGWEFDYGPEFDQLEQDVSYIPEGRITRRGCYRSYGVKRNDSDYDLKLDEDERENLLTEELEEELKYGQEFLQSDIPYMEEQKNRRYTRGGYRFYEVLRNVHDFNPEEIGDKSLDPEWKRKYHCNGVRYLDLEMCDCESEDDPEHSEHVRKGKPFRRTILNKVYQLKKEDSSEDVKRHATRVSLVPGEGRQSLYEGIPDRIRYGTEKSPTIQSAYKMADMRHGRNLADENLPRNEKGSRRFDGYPFRVKPEDDVRTSRRHPENRRPPDVRENVESWKEFQPAERRKNKEHYEHEEYRSERRVSTSRSGRRPGNQTYKQTEDREHVKKMPPHVDERIKHVRDEMERKMGLANRKDEKALKRMPLQVERDRITRDRTGRKMELSGRKDKGETLKRMPPDVEERVRNIQERMERNLKFSDRKHKDRIDSKAFDSSSSDELIDLMKHKGCPNDRGESHVSGYEKYTTTNGSEVWVKKNEKYAELHHKKHR